MKISAGAIPPKSERPVSYSVPEKQKWAFSFRFWRQYKNFGVGSCPNGWFVSLVERLAELSASSLEDLLKDRSSMQAIRYHQIDWSSKNIPCSKEDFDWIDDNYKNNSEEFPFVQFHVSKALGRVIGFFDENNIFNIVLFDPNHNMQPSKYNEYRVRPTIIGKSEIAALAISVERHAVSCQHEGCSVRDKLLDVIKMTPRNDDEGIIVVSLSSDQYDRIREISKTDACESFSEVINFAITSFESLLDGEAITGGYVDPEA